MTEGVATDAFAIARFVLRLTFVILTAVGLAISCLLIALAYAFERLYPVSALPWAFATLVLPTCGLIVLALSTRLAAFVAGDLQVSHVLRAAVMPDISEMRPPKLQREEVP
jgi:hypothetical protein